MDFRSGARKTSDPRKANTAQMAGFATAMTDEEIREAAKYFSSMPATPWIKVAESETAPKTRRPKGMMFLTLAGSEAGSEPLGQRIIETPVSADETEFCAIRGLASSPMCLRAASRREGPWLKTASPRVGARSPRARPAMDLICADWVPFQDWPGARRATLRANSMTSSTAIARGLGVPSWPRSSPTLARTICWRRLPISLLLGHRTRPRSHFDQTP